MPRLSGRFRDRRRKLGQAPLSQLVELFSRWLPELPKPQCSFRERIYTPANTFWLFFSPGDLPALCLSPDRA